MSSFKFKANWEEATEISYIPSTPTNALSIFLTRVAHMLQWMNLYWHVIITQSASFTLGFILCCARLIFFIFLSICISSFGKSINNIIFSVSYWDLCVLAICMNSLHTKDINHLLCYVFQLVIAFWFCLMIYRCFTFLWSQMDCVISSFVFRLRKSLPVQRADKYLCIVFGYVLYLDL